MQIQSYTSATSAPIFTPSEHDNTLVDYSLGSAKHNQITPKTQTWRELKSSLIPQVYADKLSIPAITPTLHNNNTRHKDSALGRTCLILDFDDGADITTISNILSPYVYAMWSTYSHYTATDNSGNPIGKYRVMIPLHDAVYTGEWENDIQHRLESWSASVFNGNNAVDPSCFRLTQLAFQPAINPAIGRSQVGFFDGADRVFFDPYKLPEVAQTTTKQRTNTPTTYKNNNINQPQHNDIDWHPTTHQRQLMIDILARKEALRHIPASNFTTSASLNRTAIAAAMMSIGCDFRDFCRLDSHMAKPDTNTTAGDIWTDAQKHPYPPVQLLIKQLWRWDRLVCGYTADTDDKDEWDHVITTEYVDYQMIAPQYLHDAHTWEWQQHGGVTYDAHVREWQQSAPRIARRHVLLCGDMGTGKNHMWQHHRGDKRVIALTPLRSIVSQSGSGNDLAAGDRVATYNQGDKINGLVACGEIDPTTTILVLDEPHNFTTAQYRLEALAAVESVLHHDWYQIIWQSASVEAHTFDGTYPIDYRLRVIKANPPSIYYRPWQCKTGTNNVNKVMTHIIDICADHAAKFPDSKSVVLWNNKEKLAELSRILSDEKGLSTAQVDAKTTKEMGTIAHKMAQNSDFKMGDVDVLVGTNSLVEGISIQDDCDNALVICVGQLHWQYIQQITGRFRKSSNVYCHHIANFNNPFSFGSRKVNGKNVAVSREEWLIAKSNEIQANNTTAINQGVADHELLSGGALSGLVAVGGGDWLITATAPLMAVAEYETAEMYSRGWWYAVEVMLGRGMICDSVTRAAIAACDPETAGVRNTIRRNDRAKKRKAVRDNLIAPFVDCIKGWQDISAAYVRQTRDDDDNSGDTLVAEMYDIILAQLFVDSTPQAVAHVLNRWADGKTTVKQITALGRAIEDNGVIAEWRAQYPTGTVMDKSAQCAAVADLITRQVALLQRIHGWDVQTASDHVTRQPRWSRSDKIAITNGYAFVTSSKPLSLVDDLIQTRPSERQIAGRRVRVVVVV